MRSRKWFNYGSTIFDGPLARFLVRPPKLSWSITLVINKLLGMCTVNGSPVMGLEAREQTREGTSGLLSAWCNFTWARVYRCVSMASRRLHVYVSSSWGLGGGERRVGWLGGRAFSLPFRIRRWKLQLSFSKYRRLELINIWDICIGDRFDSVWGERKEKNWFKNAYRRVCPEIQTARYRWKLVPVKDIERDLLIRWLEDFRKFSDTRVSC